MFNNQRIGLSILILYSAAFLFCGCEPALTEKDMVFIDARHYLETLPVGTPLKELQEKLDLGEPYDIDAPARLYPAYMVRYKTDFYCLALAADATKDAPDNIFRVETTNYLKFRGDIRLGLVFRDKVLPATVNKKSDKESEE